MIDSPRLKTLLASLEAARAHLNAILDQVQPAQWEQQVYSDGAQWSARQLLIHLSIADDGINKQMLSATQGENYIPENFDINRYNKSSVLKANALTPEDSRASLAHTRTTLYEWLETIDEAALDKTGRTGFLTMVSVAGMLDLMARHERAHADDMARALGLAIPASAIG